MKENLNKMCVRLKLTLSKNVSEMCTLNRELRGVPKMEIPKWHTHLKKYSDCKNLKLPYPNLRKHTLKNQPKTTLISI